MGLTLRALAHAAGLVAVVGFGAVGILHLYTGSLADDVERDRLLRLEQGLAERISQVRGRARPDAPASLIASTATLALAHLETRIRDTAGSHGAMIVETDPGSRDRESAEGRVGLGATLTGRMTALQAFLFALETEDPPVDVLDVSIELMGERSGDDDPILKLRVQTAAAWTLQ